MEAPYKIECAAFDPMDELLSEETNARDFLPEPSNFAINIIEIEVREHQCDGQQGVLWMEEKNSAASKIDIQSTEAHGVRGETEQEAYLRAIGREKADDPCRAPFCLDGGLCDIPYVLYCRVLDFLSLPWPSLSRSYRCSHQ